MQYGSSLLYSQNPAKEHVSVEPNQLYLITLPLRFNVMFSPNRAVGLSNSLTHSEQNFVCVSYSNHARCISRQFHHPSKNKARCTDKLNTAPFTPNTVRRSQGAHCSCRSLSETTYLVLLNLTYQLMDFYIQ